MRKKKQTLLLLPVAVLNVHALHFQMEPPSSAEPLPPATLVVAEEAACGGDFLIMVKEETHSCSRTVVSLPLAVCCARLCYPPQCLAQLLRWHSSTQKPLIVCSNVVGVVETYLWCEVPS